MSVSLDDDLSIEASHNMTSQHIDALLEPAKSELDRLNP